MFIEQVSIKDDDGNVLVENAFPGKQGFWSGVLLDAIPTVRSRFGEWNTPSLLLRGGDDVGVLGVVRVNERCIIKQACSTCVGPSTRTATSRVRRRGSKTSLLEYNRTCVYN
jgi:hypothetical protein